MAAMQQSLTSKIPIVLGAVVFIAVMIAGFLFMTRGNECLDLKEANLPHLTVVQGTDGECYYRPAE